MEKLRDAKKIKWSESYTPKTEFLKNQFEAVVGKGSYRRWEGNEIGGPGKWYVVVSPADVHEHKRAKFFAGVRKLPDSYPAGGKYFDTIKEAFEYAFDTWGTPKPQDVPPFTAGDLKGISKKIDKWKDEHKEDHEDKKASFNFDIFRIRKAMAQGIVNKTSLYFDISRFIPILESINISDPTASNQLYEGILSASSFKTRKAVEDELKHNVAVYPGESKTKIKGRDVPWRKENAGLANPKYFSVDNTSSDEEPGNFFDLAALVCTIGRMKRENCAREFLDITGKLKDSPEANAIDSRFYRSNFEEAILSAWQKYQFNVKNLKACYDFTYYMYNLYVNKQKESNKGIPPENQVPILSYEEFVAKKNSDADFAEKWKYDEKSYPIKMFVEYGRRDSACGYWIASPYNSQRFWNKRITITNQAFEKDAFGLCEIDYAILKGLGVNRVGRVTKAFVKENLPKLQALGSFPEDLKKYLQTGSVSGDGISTQAILNRGFTAREFSYVIDHINKMLPGNYSKIIDGLVEAFTGWVMFIGKEESRLTKNFKQHLRAKAAGCMYSGRKAVSDMASRESLVGLLQQEGGTLFALKYAPTQALISSLAKLKGVTAKNSDFIQKFSEEIMKLGKDSISFNEALAALKLSGASSLITKEDVMFLFGEALKGSKNEIIKIHPKRNEKFSTVLSKLISGSSANMITQNGLASYRKDATLDTSGLTPYQKAILQYSRGSKWQNIDQEFSKISGDFVPRIVATRILKNQTEDVQVKTKKEVNGKIQEVEETVKVRVFSDEIIRSFLNNYIKNTSSSAFLDFKTDLEEGDITTSVFTNGDGLVMARLTLTDYLYWKILLNRFKHYYNLAEDNPALFEDVLRTFFVPENTELKTLIDSIGAPSFIINGKQVEVDSEGNRIVFRGGDVKIVDKKGKMQPPMEKIDVVFSSSPEENCEMIEQALLDYFKNVDNRKNYKLLNSFASRYSPIKLHHPQLAFARAAITKERGLSSALSQLTLVQQKVVLEIARDLVADFDPKNPSVTPATLNTIKDSTYSGEGVSPNQVALFKEIQEAIALPKPVDCYKKIRAAFRKFSDETGTSSPYVIKNYLRKYNQQISPSVVTSKITSSLGYHTWLKSQTKDAFDDISGEFDVTKNATNSALVLNSFFLQHCRRMAMTRNAPIDFHISEEELAEHEKTYMINSRHLAVCQYMKLHGINDINHEEVRKIEKIFVNASALNVFIRDAVRQAVIKRQGTDSNIYDPFISLDKNGTDRQVWYNMALKPGWGPRSVLITANTILNWMLSGVPGQASVNISPEEFAFAIGRPTEEANAIMQRINDEYKGDIKAESLSAVLNISTEEAENLYNQFAQFRKGLAAKKAISVISAILSCTNEEAEDMFNKTMGSQKDFEYLMSENIFDNKSLKQMIKNEESVNAQTEMNATEVDPQDIVLGIESESGMEEEDAGVEDVLDESVNTNENNASTDVTVINLGVPDTASDDVPIVPPGKDANSVADAFTPVNDEDESEDDVPVVGAKKLDLGEGDEIADTPSEVSGQIKVDPTVTKQAPPEVPPPNVPTPNVPTIETPAVPVKTTLPNQEQAPTEGDSFTIDVADIDESAPPESKKSKSLLGLIRVAKEMISRKEYKKADAINKFVKSQLLRNVSESESRKLAIRTLSNLFSISKSLQKEGKYAEAFEINQIVRKHLDRLG